MSQTNNSYKKRQSRPNYDQNDGKAGVVYILRNDAFKENWLKIGQSTRSGQKRAEEINREAGTGLPKHHFCVFEHQTTDCGKAEKAIHKRLASYRKGQQEYFEVDITLAKEVIVQECARFNIAAQQQAEKESLRRKAEAEEQAANRLEIQRQEKILQAQRAQQEQNRADSERAENLLKRQAQEEAEKLKAQHQDRGIKKQSETPRAKAFSQKFQQAKKIGEAQESAKNLEVQRQERNLREQRTQQEPNHTTENFRRRQALEEVERLAKEKARCAQEEFNRMELERFKKLAEEKSRRATEFSEKFEREKQIRQAQDEAEKLALEKFTTHAYGSPTPEAAPSGSSWKTYSSPEDILRTASHPSQKSSKLRLLLTDKIIILLGSLLIISYFISHKSKDEPTPQIISVVI
ncbi:MAG: GIY-YIG nuclease family protein [Polaromonas sp.]|nr:GIY-YIG nuclease family protein [Polaromonas sp.]